MKNFAVSFIMCLVMVGALFGQSNTLTATTTAATMTANSRTITVTSATGISVGNVLNGTVGTQLFVQDAGQTRGEVMNVLSLVPNTTTSFVVSRTASAAVAHTSGAMILAGAPNLFYKYNPTGSCVRATTQVTPWLNTLTGEQWQCSTQTLSWIPSWGTPGAAQLLSGTATASAAGLTAISGPLLEISGTNAITGFTMSAGWNGQSFCTLPTAAWTVTATNNIGKAATAVADRTLCFTWNARAAYFDPSY